MTLIGGYKPRTSLELSARFSFASGRPFTPTDSARSRAQNRLVYDLTRVNAERVTDYHRLDLRFDRRMKTRWGYLTTFTEIQNVYNRKNVFQHVWNSKRGRLENLPQIAFLPVGGINIEF